MIALSISAVALVVSIWSHVRMYKIEKPKLGFEIGLYRSLMHINCLNGSNKMVWIKELWADNEKIIDFFRSGEGQTSMGVVLPSGHFHSQQYNLDSYQMKTLKNSSKIYVTDTLGNKYFISKQIKKQIKALLA